MNLHDERAFIDSDLSRGLRNWANMAPPPAPEVRERVLHRASALRWMARGESWRAWIFTFGRFTPEQHRASPSYLMWTYQTASIRMVI